VQTKMKKQFTPTFKAKVARELLREEKTMAQIGSERQVAPTQLHQWKQIAIKGLL
jgi:transposase